MIDIVSMYCNMVIKPTEEYTKELRAKVCSRKFSDWICRRLYQEYLDKAETLLYNSYRKLEKIIQEEKDFYDQLQEKMKSMN